MNSIAFTPVTHSEMYRNDIIDSYIQHCDSYIKIIMAIDKPYFIRIGGRDILLNIGDVMLLSPGVVHSTKTLKNEDFLIVQADISVLNNSSVLNGILDSILPFFTISSENNSKIYDDLKSKIIQINSDYKEDRISAELNVYFLLFDIFVLINKDNKKDHLRLYSPEKNHYDYTNKFVEICDYINEHCTENLTLDEIAKIAGFSKYHFSRLFKQFNNITFYKYLNQTRITYAVNLLDNLETSIIDIALSSGFNSLSTFLRIFKQEKRCTPSEYRKAYIL